MIIYGEYLFLENFLTGGVLLLLTAKFSGRKVSKLRLAAASILCGIGGFTIFIGIGGILAVVLRIAVGAAVSAICFGKRKLLKTTVVFMVFTFLSGGATMAFLLWQQVPALSGNGAVYMNPVTYGKLICWGIIAFGVTHVFIKLVIEKRIASITKGKVCLFIEGKGYLFEAFVDSGNSLREPLTGRPVTLIDSKGEKMLPFGRKDLPPNRYVVIPYSAVGTKKGILEGFRTDKIEFGNIELKGAVVGFYEGDFGDFEVLLNREVLAQQESYS